jgi:hypothetical protein
MKRSKYLITSLLLVLAYLCLYFLLNPFLMFQHQQLGFMWGEHFLKSYTCFPGGVAELAGIFLFQFSVNNWLGSLVYLLVLFTIFLLLKNLLKGKQNRANALVAGLPIIFLAYLLSDYSFPFYYMSVLLIGLVFLNLQHWVSSRANTLWTIISLFVLMPFMYYVLGGGAFLFSH